MTEYSLSNPPPVCHSCGTQLARGDAICSRCGAASAAPTRCPLCGSMAHVEKHSTLRFRCLVCGGPRVPVADPAIVPSTDEVTELRRALRLHRGAGLWTVAATFALVAGLISVTLGGGLAALWSPRLTVSVAVVAVASVPLCLAWWSRSRARRARESVQDALDQAWLLVAQSVLAGRGADLSVEELGRLLGASGLDSERWLARLGASDQVATRIDDSGGILYRSRVQLEPTDEQNVADDPVSPVQMPERQRSR